ncbi:diguanylate cyclase [Catenovulum sp. 2E275]|uniref:diguanylate cyclase n=1 Tax=Catenovulum sp. 2E275 TaxID=2980497 RepID=UPI0021D10CE9|nr:diguanylate cyclase [Catenovulum sp. 2E275]MCU4677422.1 diguanylate cyclase [Catenovulum sp. 2E275]
MTPDVNRQTILIVDDEPINISVLAQSLALHYRVKIATSGEKALTIVNSGEPPDLVLLDIQMPDIDGYEVLIKMRQQDETKSIPVIFITAKDAAEDEAKGLDLGAMDYITKPFNLPVVNARVRNQLALKQKADLLERLALIDGLTEIPNRRHYDNRLANEWRRCIDEGQNIAIIMIDIDEFKSFNDHYGHAQGDLALKQVAALITSQLRRSCDLAARYGGEEFVVLLPGCTLQSAQIIAEKIRVAVFEQGIVNEYSKNRQITVSLGLACIQAKSAYSPEYLQTSADNLLYQAKNSGRNQVVSAQIDSEFNANKTK